MNDNDRRLVKGAFFDGSDFLLSDDRPVFSSLSDFYKGIVLAGGSLRKGMLRMSAVLFLTAMSLISSQAEDISADSVVTRAENDVWGLKYDTSIEIGLIDALVKGTAESSHRGYGLFVDGAITLDGISANAEIAGVAGRNYAYGLYSSGGDILVRNSIAGTISATVNTSYGAASAYGYGIYTKNGSISLGGLSESGLISVTTPRETQGGRLYGIWSEKAGDVIIAGSLAGRIEVLSKGNFSYGIWAKEGVVEINSFASSGSLVVAGTFNTKGIYAYGGVTLGDMDGTIDVRAFAGNFSYGIHAATLDVLTASHIVLGNVGGTINVRAEAAEGIDYHGSSAYAVFAEYGSLTLGDVSGKINAEAMTETAMALSAKSDISMGDVATGGEIVALTKKNAYAVFAGNNGKSIDTISFETLRIGDVNGTISASASEGFAVAIFARSDIRMGTLGQSGVIRAFSDASAQAVALWTATGDIFSTEIDGAIHAESSSGDAYGIVALGLDLSLGSHADIRALSESGAAFSLYSGCYQGTSFRSYNLPDTLTLQAGARISGVIEIGGSGNNRPDTIILKGGTESSPGVFDARIQTTINTVNQSEDTRMSKVVLTVGDAEAISSESSPENFAAWTINNQDNIFDLIHISRNALLTSQDESLRVKSGGSILNGGTISGDVSLEIDATMSFATGHFLWDATSSELVLRGTGLGENVRLSVASGARLGTSIFNDTSDLILLNQDDLDAKANALFGSLLGESYNADDFTIFYHLQGSIAFGDDLVLREGRQYIVGEGARVVVGSGPLPEGSLVLQGGLIDVSSLSDTEISDTRIVGISGTLIASSSQTVRIEREGAVAYDITAGTISIGATGSSFELSGNYAADRILLGASLIRLSGKEAVLGREDSEIVLSEGATLINDALIRGGITAGDNVTLKGSGSFGGEVTLGRSSSLLVGNSPGLQTYYDRLSLGEGSSLVFSLNGVVPASPMGTDSESYSHIVFSGEDARLVTAGETTLVLDIGKGILNSTSANFSLVLIEYVEGATADPSFTDASFTTVLSGWSDLIDPNVSYTYDNNQFVVHGTINVDALKTLVSQAAISYANVLWSSADSLQNFGKQSENVLASVELGKTSLWASGIGNFTHYASQGDKPGFDSSGGGYALGAVRSWNSLWSSGLSFAQSFGTYKPSSSGLDSVKQEALMFALATSCHKELDTKDSLLVDASLAYGRVADKTEGKGDEARWDDDVYRLSLVGKWTHRLSKQNLIEPFLGLYYIDASHDGFAHTIDGDTRLYSGAALRRLVLPLGVSWQGSYSAFDYGFLPELSIAYEADLLRTNPEISTPVLGEDVSFKGSAPARNALSAQAGMRWVISPAWSASASYRVECSSGREAQSFNAGLMYTF